MKTEREIYLKPLTLREQVAMEQGICQASIITNNPINASIKSSGQGYAELDADAFVGDNTGSNGGWEIEWK